jgi:hypothetical protein
LCHSILILCDGGNANGRRGGVFSPDHLTIREKTHVRKIYDGRFGRVRFACERCVCANSDDNHRPGQQHGAGRRVGLLVTWRLACIEDHRTQRVYDNNENVGSINDLLTDKNGSIKAVVIGVGGFLGVGTHLVAVSFDKIKFVDSPLSIPAPRAQPGGARPSTSTTTGAATTAPASRKSLVRITPCSLRQDQLKSMPGSNIRPEGHRFRVVTFSMAGHAAGRFYSRYANMAAAPVQRILFAPGDVRLWPGRGVLRPA